MRSTVLLAACLAALSACSKSNSPTEDHAPPTAQPASTESAPLDAKTAALANAVKKDFAARFVASASEACASSKGQEMPDLKTGSPMQYSAAGVLSWGKGSFDYVKEPGAKIVLSNSREEQTFAFGVDVYDLATNDRKYVAGMTRLKGAAPGVTVTDDTHANGDANLSTSNLCAVSTVPPLVTQGAWPLAAQHLQVPKTDMSCFALGKFDKVTIPFSFDGKTLQAGAYRFTEADAAHAETLTIDPSSNSAGVMYSVSKADESGAGVGLSQAGVLTYASLNVPGSAPMVCAPK